MSQKGYTFIELMMVLATMASLTMLGLATVSTQTAHQRLTDAGRQLISDLRLVRQKAITEGISKSIRFDPNGRKYLLPDFGERALPSQTYFGLRPEVSPLPNSTRPDDGVSFQGNTVVFQPNGTIMGVGGAVYLTHDAIRNEAIAISVITTGRVKIRRWSGNAWQ